MSNIASSAPVGTDTVPMPEKKAEQDQRTQEDVDFDNALADQLSRIVENANEKLLPICNKVRMHIENMEAQKEEDRDEGALVQQVRPELEDAEKILNETNGAIQGLDPDKKLVTRAKRTAEDHSASPSEQRLAEALKVMMVKVQDETVNWAKGKLDSFPKAKRDLGPLLDALGQPITQIVGGVGLLLAGVLNLLGNLLSGLGLDSLLKGIVAATGLDKIYRGLGLEKWLKSGKAKD